MLSWNRLTDVCDRRNLAITEKGYLALVPELANVNDEIHVLRGRESFFLLRQVDVNAASSGHYHALGNCYLYGMNGADVETDISAASKITLH
jgi:hypothetical protein